VLELDVDDPKLGLRMVLPGTVAVGHCYLAAVAVHSSDQGRLGTGGDPNLVTNCGVPFACLVHHADFGWLANRIGVSAGASEFHKPHVWDSEMIALDPQAVGNGEARIILTSGLEAGMPLPLEEVLAGQGHGP